ncbi:ABC transporter substrate-binding protein [Acetobacter sp.]|uniref:ABC transporter substrate-binding protein n=1 Tax=Acetobacter sp. TaxID=440 RepID=UPI0025C4EC05|nr:ABC transporter substrate-binding protein [Acetobacter sp.]MCH4092487.1 ABC transporter substrate-binding protein [Acetobacter sp.]MCI1299621.1 ABC transporter substrate-binding protein [Acetobacter sp.]MCI1315499.1 ABC transporter substrate-binding protein [Acetobacter sp.]
MTGVVGELPARPAHIADLWYAHNEILVMLGGAPTIAMTVERESMSPWMYHLAPALRNATQLPSTTPTAETLLAGHVDLVFATPSLSGVETYRKTGIPTVGVEFHDTAGLLRCLDLTATVLDTPHAQTVARDYRAYLNETEKALTSRLAAIPEASRPRVLHILSLSPMKVDGAGTMIDEWIRLAGGRNAAEEIKGAKRPVSLEQIAAWNPDIIILGGMSGDAEPKTDGPVWNELKAVKAGKVYRNPVGVFPWDRYGTEFALQIQWAATIIHPEFFHDTDMMEITRAFYRRFFSYDLAQDEARRILAAQPPA